MSICHPQAYLALEHLLTEYVGLTEDADTTAVSTLLDSGQTGYGKSSLSRPQTDREQIPFAKGQQRIVNILTSDRYTFRPSVK